MVRVTVVQSRPLERNQKNEVKETKIAKGKITPDRNDNTNMGLYTQLGHVLWGVLLPAEQDL